VAGHRGHPGRDEYGIEPSADLVAAPVRLPRARGLQAEPVFDGDEVEQAALGLLYQVRPVPGREQIGRAGTWLAPRGRMPAGAVERKRQMERRARTQGTLPSGQGYGSQAGR